MNRLVFHFFVVILSLYLIFSAIFVYITIKDGFKFSDGIKTKREKQYVIAIIGPENVGEKQQTMMLKIAAENLGHLAYTLNYNFKFTRIFFPAKYLLEIYLRFLDYKFNTDMHIAVSFHVNLNLPEPKLMHLALAPDYFKRVIKRFPAIREYNNFLDINLINSVDDWLSELLAKKVKRKIGIIGVPASSYVSSKREKLVMYGSLWGRDDSGFKSALAFLAKEKYMYFIKHQDLIFPGQQLFKENKDPEELKKILNQNGIAIAVHSDAHIALPTSRIFEIISAGAIAISDQNPFIHKYFGNNILYFNRASSGEEIFSKINSYYHWIQNNPIEAEKMARKAHKILQENFTTEIFIKNAITLLFGKNYTKF